ncbi:hypothetical protein [Streptomyces sp. NPDC014733]|uniref:hypothetical protein n=1 Tax=Streptomyces sp. NPDC014733 TaxID=3364885 RepID=UPI0036FA1B40
MVNEQAGNGRSAGAGEPGGPGVHQGASARDHGVTNQAGRDQTVINNHHNYYGAPPRPTSPPAPPGGGRGPRTSVLAAAGGVVGAVVLAVVLSSLTTSGGGHGTDDGPTPGPTTTTPTTTAPTTPPPSKGPTSPAPGTVRWKGPLRLDNSDVSKEMDTKPPAVVENSDPGADLWFWDDMDGLLKTSHHAVVAEWTGDGLPTAQQCADAVGGGGTEDLPLATGKVICFQTSDHRIGRLKVTKFWYDVGDGGATFDAVVWEKG